MQNNEVFFIDQAPFDAEQGLSSLIQAESVGHDPFDLGDWLQAEHILGIIRRNSAFRSMLLAPSQGFTIVGMSGIGKWRII